MDAHIVISTRQNTVNAIPLLMEQFQGRAPLILSSAEAENNHWTANLAFVLKNHGLAPEIHRIAECESDDNALISYIRDLVSSYGSVCFNISGGKKNQTLPLLSVYIQRNNPEDRLVYVDSKPFRILVYSEFDRIAEFDPQYLLDLEDISNLYGYTCFRRPGIRPDTMVNPAKLIMPADRLRKLNHAFLTNFEIAKLIYKYFDKQPTDLDDKSRIKQRIEEVLNEYRPTLEECELKTTAEIRIRYEKMFSTVKDIREKVKGENRKPTFNELVAIWKTLTAFPRDNEIFDQYWSLIRKAIVGYVMDSCKIDDPVLFHERSLVSSIITRCNELTGNACPDRDKIRWSDVKELLGLDFQKGFLFEGILALALYDLIREKRPDLLKRLHMNVKPYKLAYDDNGGAKIIERKENENVVEFDLVYVTDHGTIHSFECKTFGHQGDILKSKSYSTESQGGVYSETIMVTQLQKQHLDLEEMKDYIPNKVTNQVQALQKYNPKLWYFDQVREMIESIL